MNRYPLSLIMATALCLNLTACEQPTGAGQDETAAKVGNETIRVAELNHALSRLGPLDAAGSRAVTSKVLDALIDQRLVEKAAQDAGLHKDPEVALALQQVQRQVLFDAYMERIYKDMPKPSESEIQEYYRAHPELFSARKLYRIQEIELRMAASRVAEVENQLKQGNKLSAFSDWLEAQKIEHKSGVGIKPAEQIPDAILAQLKDMDAGQVTVLATGPDSVSVLQLQASQLKPVSLEQAKPAIARVVANNKRKTLLGTEINRLRGMGKIEYAKGYEPVGDDFKASAPKTAP